MNKQYDKRILGVIDTINTMSYEIWLIYYYLLKRRWIVLSQTNCPLDGTIKMAKSFDNDSAEIDAYLGRCKCITKNIM
jgi:hypothetical protein